jgi:hypothetical protein
MMFDGSLELVCLWMAGFSVSDHIFVAKPDLTAKSGPVYGATKAEVSEA